MLLSVPLTGTKVRKRPFQWPENRRFGGRNGRFGGRNGRFGFRKGTKTNGYEKECKSHAKIEFPEGSYKFRSGEIVRDVSDAVKKIRDFYHLMDNEWNSRMDSNRLTVFSYRYPF